MKNNRLCAGLALLLCLAAVPTGAQPEQFRANMRAIALGPLLMACVLVPTISLLEALSDRAGQPDDAGRMGIVQRFIHWAKRGAVAKRPARFYWRIGLPFAFFVEGLGYIADRSSGLVAGGVLAASLSALATGLVYKLHISIDEQLAHWLVKLDALLGFDMENDERNQYLYECIGDNRINRVKVLLAHGADPNYAAGWPRSILQGASSNGNPDVLAALLEYGANVGAEDFIDAVRSANPAVVNQLCQSATAIDAVCDLGDMLWIECVQGNGLGMARVLASRGLLKPEIGMDSTRYPAAWRKRLQNVSAAEFSRRRQSIAQSLDRHNVPKDIAGLITSFSDGPEAVSLIKRHKQACDMLE